jgi:PAS domain S-box-containing protein
MLRPIILHLLQLSISLVILLSGLSPAAGADPGQAARKILVAVPPDFPPTYSRDQLTGKPKGFAIDVMNEVARRAGIEVEYSFGQEWDDLQEMLLSGKADLIPNLTIDEDRKKRFIFTLPVESLPFNLIVRKDYQKVSALAPGVKVGVIRGSVSYTYLKSRRDLTLIAYQNLQSMLFDLLAGQIDMVFAPTPNIMKLATDTGVEEKVRVLEPPLMEGKRGMALRRGDTELLKRLDDVIDDFVGSQKYQDIYAKWWGKPPQYWTPGKVAAIIGVVFLLNILVMGTWRYRSISGLISQLRRSEKKYRALFNGSNDAIFVREFTESGRFGSLLEVNDIACRLLGYTRDELMNLSVYDINSQKRIDTLSAAQTSLAETGSAVFESIHRTKGGSDFPVEINAHKFELEGKTVVLSIVRDITDRRQLEQQVMQNQKLESIGLLAGGIAHDFNNLLSPMIVYSEMICMQSSPGDSINKRAAAILDAANKAKEMIAQLLSFSRKQVLSVYPYDLNEITDSFMSILRRTIRETIEVRQLLSKVICPIVADRTQIEQILLNLAVNAQDAIVDTGVITIETGHILLDNEYCQIHAGARPGPYVMLAFSDTGCGMDDATLSHVFEPFFTTKPVGHGTGLGLSTVYGIVKQHEGYIDVQSNPGRGSTFRIYLPERTSRNCQSTSLSPMEITEHATSATILLVEDNAIVMEMAKDLLESNGHTVLAAGAPEDALSIARNTACTIDLLITDVVMPQMNGPELHERLLDLLPGLKTLYMSGYGHILTIHNGAIDEGVNFIPKPFTSEELLRTVSELLLSDE